MIPRLHNRIALTNYMIEGCSSIDKLKDFIESMHENRIFSFHQKFFLEHNKIDKDALRDELRVCIALQNRIRQDFQLSFNQEAALMSMKSKIDIESLIQ